MGTIPRQMLINRVTITFAVILTLIVGWNAYVAANNDGVLTGQVVDSGGRAVGGAKVTITARTVAHDLEIGSIVSGDDGVFRFEKHGQYNLVLTAEKDGVGKSAPRHIRLYFRNQDFALETPLVLSTGSTNAQGS